MKLLRVATNACCPSMLISKTSESKEIVDKFIHDLQMAERLEAAAKSLNESGCNLYRRMIIRVFCDPDKKRKVEVDFGNGGLLFGENPLFEELPALATLLEKNLDDWSQHLKALRDKAKDWKIMLHDFPAINLTSH